MDSMRLPPDLEQFAADAVAAGLRLLLQQEAARAELLASVLAAEEEAGRLGWLTGDEVRTHVLQTIARRAGRAA